MLSGVGPERVLREAGVAVTHDLPGVGRDLHDHYSISCVWEAGAEKGPPIPRSQVAMFWKTRPDLAAPNAYAYARRGPALTPENAARYAPPAECWSLVIGLRPASRGSVRIASADLDAPPMIDAGYLAEDRDLEDLAAATAMARTIGAAPALGRFTGRGIAPGPAAGGELETYLRRGLGTFWHACGTARMGRDALAVVDGRLRVHGLRGLRVADASVLPHVTAGNTMAPCVVIGEQVARFIQGTCAS
jgi:choline dehydrogenase